MTPARPSVKLRDEGHLTEALLLFLKQLTGYARWVFAALLLFYAISGIRSIEPQQTALVRRLGRLQTDLHNPGLLFCLPRPFDEVLLFETGKDTTLPLDGWALIGGKIGDPDKQLELSQAELQARVNSSEVKGSEYPVYENTTLDPVRHGYTLTGDIHVIQGRFSLRYRIDDPFCYTVAGDHVPSLLRSLSYQALTAQLARRPVDASLTEQRRDVATAAARDIQAGCDRLKLGLRISGLDILELSPPAQVLAAFEDVTNARQQAKTLFENARQYDSETRTKFEGEAAAIGYRAEAYATELVETARGEAAAFTAVLTNYQRSPRLVSQHLLRETLNEVMRQVSSRTLLPASRSMPSLILEPAPEFAR